MIGNECLVAVRSGSRVRISFYALAVVDAVVRCNAAQACCGGPSYRVDELAFCLTKTVWVQRRRFGTGEFKMSVVNPSGIC